MTIAYAALHKTLRYRGEDTKLYCVAFTDGTMFFSRHQPPLYDRDAVRIAMREIVPGSQVNVRYRREGGVNVLEAVQLVREPVEKAPFEPVPDDGHL
jgi:hypothetical protein